MKIIIVIKGGVFWDVDIEVRELNYRTRWSFMDKEQCDFKVGWLGNKKSKGFGLDGLPQHQNWGKVISMVLLIDSFTYR